MSRIPAVTLLCGVYLSACGEQPTAAPPNAAPDSPVPAVAPARVGTIGVLLRREGSAFILQQQELGFKPSPSWRAKVVKHDLPVGKAGSKLHVITDETTPVYMGGSRSALDAVPLGTALLVVGERSGERLRAALVTDLQAVTPPPAEWLALAQESEQPTAAVALERSEATASVTSLCLGQDMDYTAADIHEFHGCWGGPSASDIVDVPDVLGFSGVPFGCVAVAVGCWVVDQFSYTLALGGWAFDFPFRFSAAGAGLTYHVPGNVSLRVEPLPASGTAFTFTGGLGLDYGLNVDFCFVVGDCFEITTIHVGLSMTHQTTGAGPLLPSQQLDIAEASCPSVGVLVIPNFPLDPLSLALCADLRLNGRSFFAKVTAEGTNPVLPTRVAFDPSPKSLSVLPDALQLTVKYSEFSWSPDMTAGYVLRLEMFGEPLVATPSLTLVSGAWPAVSTPFPGPDFTVATDPLSPVGDLRYLFQPTIATVAFLPVARAPTTLAIVSASALAEGEPVRARLTESYDGSAIAGVEVAFTATTSTGSSTVFGRTDGNGVAQAVFTNGEYALQAQFAGTQFYVATAANQPRVLVYRPTTFVIWGGNAEGITAGRRYQFWGAEWFTQVTGGNYTAGESFKGFAHTATASTWTAGGGNPAPPPAEVAEYIGVIVATSAAKLGPSIVGNIAARAVLRVDLASYGPTPGHPGFGTLQAQVAN